MRSSAKLLASAGHRDEVRLVQGAPPSPVAQLDVERRERKHIGLEVACFEEHVWLDDLVAIGRVDADQGEEAALLLREHSPSPASPSDALTGLEEGRNCHRPDLCSHERRPAA